MRTNTPLAVSAAVFVFTLCLTGCGDKPPAGPGSPGTPDSAIQDPAAQGSAGQGSPQAGPSGRTAKAAKVGATSAGGGDGPSSSENAPTLALPGGVPAGAGPELAPKDEVPAGAQQRQEVIALAELPLLGEKLDQLIAQVEHEHSNRNLALEQVMAEKLKTNQEVGELRAKAGLAEQKNDKTTAVANTAKADALSAKLAAQQPVSAPENRDAANAAFEARLLRFRQQVKAQNAVEARASLNAMLQSAGQVSPSMLLVLKADLRVLQERGGHY